MTPAQLILLGTARRQAGVDERGYRMILKHVADVASSKQLTNQSFEDVMAVLEERGFRKPGAAEDHFRNKVKLRGTFSGERVVHKIHELLAGTIYQHGLAGLCRRFSNDRTDQPSKLTPTEAYALVEMLKNAQCREAKTTTTRKPRAAKALPALSHGGEDYADEPF